MQPIFKEMIQMWNDLGYPLPIEEGKYWLENHFICGFTNDGELHKLYKYKVLDDLSIEITPYKHKINLSDIDFETWEQTVERLDNHIWELKYEAILVITNIAQQYSSFDKYVMTSTGKDSCVVLDLVCNVIPDVNIVFNNTSIDSADTYRMVKKHKNWIITNPKIGFYKWIKDNNFIPSRLQRACCGIFKEAQGDKYLIDNNVNECIMFMGIRNSESSKRSSRQYIEHDPKWGDKNWFSCLPIRKWSDFDVWLYILKYNLEINPKYRKGYSRVGCSVVCPYATKYSWVLDKYWYEYAYNRWRKILKDFFVRNDGWIAKKCTIDEFTKAMWNASYLPSEPTEEVVTEFMEHKGLDNYDTALQYFNKTCEVCGRNVRQNDVLAMNLKLLGRSTNKIYCKKHLKELNGMSNEDWDNTVADFKRQGCALF